MGMAQLACLSRSVAAHAISHTPTRFLPAAPAGPSSCAQCRCCSRLAPFRPLPSHPLPASSPSPLPRCPLGCPCSCAQCRCCSSLPNCLDLCTPSSHSLPFCPPLSPLSFTLPIGAHLHPLSVAAGQGRLQEPQPHNGRLCSRLPAQRGREKVSYL